MAFNNFLNKFYKANNLSEVFQIIRELLPRESFEQGKDAILVVTAKECEGKLLDECKDIIRTYTLTYFHAVLEIHEIDKERQELLMRKLNELMIKLLDKAENKAFEDFRENLSRCDEWVGQELFGYLSDVFKRDIYFIDSETRMPYIMGGCDDYQHRKSIVVLWLNQGHYEIVGRREKAAKGGYVIQREFEPNDSLIQKIYTLLCEPNEIPAKFPDMISFLPKEVKQAFGIL